MSDSLRFRLSNYSVDS